LVCHFVAIHCVTLENKKSETSDLVKKTLPVTHCRRWERNTIQDNSSDLQVDFFQFLGFGHQLSRPWPSWNGHQLSRPWPSWKFQVLGRSPPNQPHNTNPPSQQIGIRIGQSLLEQFVLAVHKFMQCQPAREKNNAKQDSGANMAPQSMLRNENHSTPVGSNHFQKVRHGWFETS